MHHVNRGFSHIPMVIISVHDDDPTTSVNGVTLLPALKYHDFALGELVSRAMR